MKLITQILHKYREPLGDDYQAYHHHAQRVYQYAITLLLQRESKKLAICAAFHDLDIWTNGSMDYLPGSSTLALSYQQKSDIDLVPEEVSFIIKNHHKLRKIKGNIEAEAFRKADLIDLTAGRIRFNIPLSLIQESEKQFPRSGFTNVILGKTMKHAIKNPLNPFPMVRW